MDITEDWEEDLRRRYPQPVSAEEVGKCDADFRNYSEAKDHVKEFYRLNHRFQTVDFVREKREQYLPLRQGSRSIWSALEFLNTLVDDSDPDIELPQIAHLMQTAEAIRAENHPRWFVLAGLMHDLGKVLCLYGEPQWAVVGDTFPVGCRYSPKIVYPEYFSDNPDSHVEEYQTQFGIYEPNCGFSNLIMSWGHDEYIYQVTRDYLPIEAQYMLRYHSFYAAHREGEYEYFMDEQDREYFPWVQKFNRFDLYTKSSELPDVAKLKPYYSELIDEFFPSEIAF